MGKIKLKDQLGRVININDEATKGATLGRDLYGPDGKLLKASDILNPAQGNASAVATIWKLIREVPANIQKLATLIGKGFAIRRDDGEWALRTLQPGTGIEVANGDGEAGDPSISLTDLPPTTDGTLQAITLDAQGRVSGTRAATITGTASQIAVANGTAAAGLPTISLADLADTGVGAALVKVTRDAKGRISGSQAASTTDLAEGANLYFTNARADARITAQKGQPNGIADLDAGGKIPTARLPAIAITETFVVASQAAQLALTAQEGDVAVRTDQSKNYIRNAGTSGTMTDWTELLTPAAPVQSVNGKTGTVNLIPSDIGAATAAQGAKADSAVQSVVPGARITVNNTDPRNPIVSADADKSGVFIGGVELTSPFVSSSGSSTIVAIPGMNFSFVMPDRPVMISFGSTAFYNSPTASNLAAIILRVNGVDSAQLFFSAAITNYWSQGKQFLLSGVAPGTVINLAWYLNRGPDTFTVFAAATDKPYIYVVTA